MGNCSQCGKPAMFLVGDPPAVPLCLNCNDQFLRMIERHNDMLEREMNFLTEHMEAQVGLSGVLPRYPRRSPPVVQQTGPATFNNIRVAGGMVGAINTGVVQQLDVAIGQVREAGAAPLADVVKDLTEALLRSNELNAQQKNDTTEQLTLLLEQAQMRKEQRKPGLIRAALAAVKDTVTTVSGLVSLWERARPQLEQLLSFISPAG